MDPLSISGVDRRKDEKEKKGVVVTAVITYKTPFMVHGKLAAISLDLGEGMAHNTIFPWQFLKK